MKYKKEILNLKKNGYAVFKSAITKNYLDKITDIISQSQYQKQLSVRVIIKLQQK